MRSQSVSGVSPKRGKRFNGTFFKAACAMPSGNCGFSSTLDVGNRAPARLLSCRLIGPHRRKQGTSGGDGAAVDRTSCSVGNEADTELSGPLEGGDREWFSRFSINSGENASDR